MTQPIQVDLNWAVNKFGTEHFSVYARWGRSKTIFRKKTISTLREPPRNFYGAYCMDSLPIILDNFGKKLQGKDTEEVKEYAHELVARIVPKTRRMSMPIVQRVQRISEGELPQIAENQDIEIPTFYIVATDFRPSVCEDKLREQLYPLGLTNINFDYQMRLPERP